MDGVLSQEEISALLNDPNIGTSSNEKLTDVEKDAIGEISNISMGTAATTLFSLVNRKVDISTPVVSYSTWEDLTNAYERPCVFIRIAYTVGLDGSNILVLKENDVKIITDLMMGGNGTNTESMELGELQLSAISEAMNQMMGSAATSLSSMLNKTIDISPPMADLIDLQDNIDESAIDEFLSGEFVCISFRMEIGDLVDSEIMQLYPVSFAKEMCDSLMNSMGGDSSQPETSAVPETPAPAVDTSSQMQSPQMQSQPAMDMQMANPQMMNQQMTNPQMMGQPMMNPQMMGQPMMNPQMMGQPMMNPQMMNQQMMNPQMMGQPMMMQQPVNVQPAQFGTLSNVPVGTYQPENIDLIMDVPLEVTVELGRTHKSISDILDFAPGKIIELNRLAGEPIDVLVNGKHVAKGEVVVIEEYFGVRITEIINNTVHLPQ